MSAIMNAIISGSAHMAILVDGDNLTTIVADSTDSPVSASRSTVHHLLHSYSDIEFVEDRTLDEIRKELKVASLKCEALTYCLMILDSSFTLDLRRELAIQAARTLTDDTVPYVLNVLYSYSWPASTVIEPLPSLPDTPETAKLIYILNSFKSKQTEIERVRASWDAIPRSLFGQDNDSYMQFQAMAVKQGIFRNLVELSQLQRRTRSFFTDWLANQSITMFDFHEAVMTAWEANLFEQRGWGLARPPALSETFRLWLDNVVTQFREQINQPATRIGLAPSFALGGDTDSRGQEREVESSVANLTEVLEYCLSGLDSRFSSEQRLESLKQVNRLLTDEIAQQVQLALSQHLPDLADVETALSLCRDNELNRILGILESVKKQTNSPQ